jgi:hypothetical protein
MRGFWRITTNVQRQFSPETIDLMHIFATAANNGE